MRAGVSLSGIGGGDCQFVSWVIYCLLISHWIPVSCCKIFKWVVGGRDGICDYAQTKDIYTLIEKL